MIKRDAEHLLVLLSVVHRYLTHPDVQAIPFALPAAAVAMRVDEAMLLIAAEVV